MSSMANYVKMSDLKLLLLFNRGLRCLTMDICMIAITQLGVLLHSADSILSFEENTVIIPEAVIEEINYFRK